MMTYNIRSLFTLGLVLLIASACKPSSQTKAPAEEANQEVSSEKTTPPEVQPETFDEAMNHLLPAPTPEDPVIKELKRMADNGDSNAQYELATKYINGEHLEKPNLHEAAKWMTEAAGQGHAEAQAQLAHFYANDLGVTRNFKEAARWYQSAAEQGLAEAQNGLGEAYQLGRGVEKDMNQAIHWFQEAAKQNHAKAQSNLGVVHEFGVGVEKDPVMAAAWYNLAAKNGNEAADRRYQQLSANFSTNQRTELKKHLQNIQLGVSPNY